MGKLKYGIATVAIAAIIGGAIPYITKNSIDNVISKKKNNLITNGIDLNVISSDGYINSKREILIKIQDTIKFIDYVSKNLDIDTKILNELTNDGSLLENISIKGTMLNTNFFPNTIDVSLAFQELPNDLKELMREEPLVKQLINSLDLKLKLDTNGNVTFVSLNDIVMNDENITAKMLKHKTIINENNYLTSIQNITLKINEIKEKFLIYFDDIKEDLHYENSFNFNDIITINKIKLDYANNNNEIVYASENNKMDVNSNSKDDELNIEMKYSIGNSSLNTNDIDAKFDNFIFNLKFNNLKEQPVRELVNYENSDTKVLNIVDQRLQEIINYGFSINFESNISNISNKKSNVFEAKNINVNLTAKLKRNNLNENSDVDTMLKNISVIGVIKMDKNIIDLIKPIQQYNTNIINGISEFDIKFIDGKLFVNEHKVI